MKVTIRSRRKQNANRLTTCVKERKTQRIAEIAYRNLEKVGVDRNTARILVKELDDDDKYTPSAECGDYSPSNPWNAP